MRRPVLLAAVLAALTAAAFATPVSANDGAVKPPEGFIALFNGENLDGWWGLGTVHYKTYRDLSPEDFEKKKEESRKDIRQH